jgi:predicted amidohydrolase
MIVAPDGRIQAQTQLQREQVLVEEIDIDLATRAMFRIGEGEQDTAVDDSGAMLFGDTVDRSEWT